jgi:lysophospholipase L1-like esterase
MVGIAGATASGLGRKAQDFISRVRPTTVAIQLGINDATAAALQPPSERAETLSRALLALKNTAAAAREGGITTIVMTVPGAIRAPLWQRLWFGPDRERFVEELNARIRRLPQEIPVEILDADVLLRSQEGLPDEAYRYDSLHWNAKAYKRLNQAMLAILLRSGRCSG